MDKDEVKVEDIIKCGEKFLETEKQRIEVAKQNGKYYFSRYESWDICYNKFMNNESKDVENLTLHLAFYLASWGMYRGSTSLLQNNYRIHRKPVEIICEFIKKNKNDLMEEKFIDWDKIKDLKDELEKCYINVDVYKITDDSIKGDIKYELKKFNFTDTLVTKILLGTTGIVPAYDGNVVASLKAMNKISKFNEASYDELIKMYEEKTEDFEELRNSYCELFKDEREYHKMKCPKMKILDMCLWEYYNDKIQERKHKKK